MHTIDPTWGQLLFVLLILASCLAIFCVQIYGTYVSFCKKWYIGLAALVFPGFAVVVGAAKLFKKDLLK